MLGREFGGDLEPVFSGRRGGGRGKVVFAETVGVGETESIAAGVSGLPVAFGVVLGVIENVSVGATETVGDVDAIINGCDGLEIGDELLIAVLPGMRPAFGVVGVVEFEVGRKEEQIGDG